LLFIDGNVSKPQLIAALYLLKLEIFKLAAEEEAALKTAMKEAEAESDKGFSNVLIGKFDVLDSSVGDWSGGVVTTFKGKDDSNHCREFSEVLRKGTRNEYVQSR
jgi:hypothetical protein